MEKIWKDLRGALKRRIAAHSYRMWIEPLGLERSEGGHWVILCPNAFSRKRVQDHFGETIRAELARLSGEGEGGVRVEFQVAGRRPSRGAEAAAGAQLPLPSEAIRPHNGRFLRRDYTFEHFVVGAGNDFAYSASLSLASRKGCTQPAVFLYSGTGLGKSHLSQAIGHHVLQHSPQERVYYMTAEDFSNEMVQAFRRDALDQFKAKYRRQCDVLLLEDVHGLGGKERTQIELAATLDSLLESGKRILFSSACRPAEIPRLHDSLRSRLSCSLITAIEPPNYRTRLRILQHKARLHGYEIPAEVFDFLATELVGDVRQLESGLNGVAARSSLLGSPIDLKLAETVVQQMISGRRRITVELIKKLVCEHYRVSEAELVSPSRRQHLVRPRQMAIFLARRFTDTPLQAIGRSFNRYHATVLHSIQAIERGVKIDPALREQVDFFQKRLESPPPGGRS